MLFEEKKDAYARLVVTAGVHVRPGQKVFLGSSVEMYEFARLIVKYAYEAGASEVLVRYTDVVASRATYDHAPMEVFETVHPWEAEEMNTYAKTDVAFIYLAGDDPDAMKGVDFKKVAARQRARHEALKDYYKLQSTMGFKWNIVGVPTRAWAEKVFPLENPDVAMTRLWNAIFSACRIGEGDAYERWMAHADDLKARSETLNAWQFDALRYKSSNGTDFTVGLVKDHRWEGGADIDKKDGGRFFANMPTEEVFTMPDRRRAEGKLVASMPLSFHGSLIEKFSFTFHEGKVVEYDAERGKDTLKSLLETDEGSLHLGECALVPLPSPVADTKVLFLETLFDENAACHFALGACYETNLLGGEKMSDEELLSHGANLSANHVDFMVGTPDLSITGILSDGREIPVFKDGTWAF